MDGSVWRRTAPLAGCCILAFLIPFPFIFATLGIWFLALTWLIAADYRHTFIRFGRSGYYLAWLLYFTLFAVSYFYSDNKGEALFDTVGKLSFVIIPLLAGAGMPMERPAVGRILLAFVAGLIVTSFYCLGQAALQYRQDGNSDHFFYHALVRGLDANAVYMAWYVITGIACLLLFPWRQSGLAGINKLRWPFVVFLFCFLMLLASRLLVLYCIVVVIPAFLFREFSHRRHRRVLASAILVLLTTLGLLLTTDNPVRDRFREVMHPDLSTVTVENYHTVEPEWNNLTARLFIWRIGIENVREHKLWLHGTGNGDVHRIQNQRIAYHGLLGMNEDDPVHGSLYNVNLHNMYLQSLIAIGLPGLLTLLAILLMPIIVIRKSKWGRLSAVVTVNCALFMMQESALQTQAGVVFFTFISVILWHGVKKPGRNDKAAIIAGN